jgi:hypothetical protein
MVWGCEVDLFDSRYGLVAVSCEHGNDPSGSKNRRVFLGQLNDCQLLKKGCDSW